MRSLMKLKILLVLLLLSHAAFAQDQTALKKIPIAFEVDQASVREGQKIILGMNELESSYGLSKQDVLRIVDLSKAFSSEKLSFIELEPKATKALCVIKASPKLVIEEDLSVRVSYRLEIESTNKNTIVIEESVCLSEFDSELGKLKERDTDITSRKQSVSRFLRLNLMDVAVRIATINAFDRMYTNVMTQAGSLASYCTLQ